MNGHLDREGSSYDGMMQVVSGGLKIRYWSIIGVTPEMAKYFFHTLDGQRTIDHVGTPFNSLDDAKLEAVARMCRWVMNDKRIIIVDRDCRMEVANEKNETLYSLIMFAVDNKVWAGRS